MDDQLKKEKWQLLHTLENLIEGPMIFLGFVWLLLLIADLIWGLSPVLQTISLIIWIIFIADFLIKFVLAPAKLPFLRKNWLTALSLVLPALRVFRLVRILRLFKGARLIRIVGSLNRGMKSLGETMGRRGSGYVMALCVVVTLGGAAGMYAIEKGHQGFENYGMALWWTSMRIITAGSDFWPATPEGRVLAFILSLFGYAIFGYVTATLATYFIGRDAEEEEAPVAGAKDVQELKSMISVLTKNVQELKAKMQEPHA